MSDTKIQAKGGRRVEVGTWLRMGEMKMWDDGLIQFDSLGQPIIYTSEFTRSGGSAKWHPLISVVFVSPNNLNKIAE